MDCEEPLIDYEGEYMNCPSCNQIATSLLRSAFSLQGVSIVQSTKGYFKCQNCGTLLRITGFGRQFWYFFGGTTAVLIAFALLHKRLILEVGTGATAAIWIKIVLVIMSIFTFGLWKYAQIERVGTIHTTDANKST
jgi:hypothetical protein